MKRMFHTRWLNGILALSLAVLMIYALCPQKAQAADTRRYGYAKLENGNQKQLYVLLADALEAGKDELSLSGRNFRESDLKAAEAMVRRDYPEFFYYTSCCYSVNSKDMVQSVELQYMLDGKSIKGGSSELKAARAALDAKVGEIVNGVSGDDFHKAHYLHDYIVNNVVYVSSPNDQNAYGALIEGQAVCAGYSHAYQLLLRKAGIENFYITGTSKGMRHAWLLVFLNDECYYTDVTWDDPITDNGSQLLGHYYLDMSYNEISKDHQIDPEYEKWLPTIHDHKDMCYFEHEAGDGTGVGNFTEQTDPKQLFEALKRDGNSYRCEFVYKGSDFESWFNKALQNVANNLGEIGISYTVLGGEYILTITVKASEHVLQKIPAKTPTCLADGNEEHYECTKCGKRFADADAITWLSSEDCVVISKLSHSDGDGNNKCDTCGKQMSASAVAPGKPSTDVPEETTPVINTPEETKPAQDIPEVTTPVEDAPVSAAPEADPTQETNPAEDATENTMQPGDVQENDATENGGNVPVKPAEDELVEGGSVWVIVAAAVVAVIAAAVGIVRKTRGY